MRVLVEEAIDNSSMAKLMIYPGLLNDEEPGYMESLLGGNLVIPHEEPPLSEVKLLQSPQKQLPENTACAFYHN